MFCKIFFYVCEWARGEKHPTNGEKKTTLFRIAFVGAPWARRVKQTCLVCKFVAKAGANFMFASGQGV